MADADALLFEKRGGVATLTLHRPEARNALTSAMFRDMERVLLEVAEDADVRVLVLTGAGRGFSAGADLKPVPREERRRTEKPSFPEDAGGDILDRGNRCMAAVHASASLPFDGLLDFEARNQRAVGRSDDAKEGVRAFLERRKPEFRGR